jgi:hypothetical protein
MRRLLILPAFLLAGTLTFAQTAGGNLTVTFEWEEMKTITP